MRLTNGHQRRPSTCTNHPQKKEYVHEEKNCTHGRTYSVPHSLPHARGYMVELISGWRGSSRDNLTRLVVVNLVEGREPRVDESKFDHSVVACLFFIFFLNGTWIMHILNDGARDGMVAMDMVGPFWRLLHWYFYVHFEKNYYFDASCQLAERWEACLLRRLHSPHFVRLVIVGVT